jgi:hypothetical protein
MILPVLLACAQSQVPSQADPRSVEDEAALSAFESLSPADRKDLADYFHLEAKHLGSFQLSLVAFVLNGQDRDPAAWPEEQAAPVFDSKEHTPENDIPRHPLEAGSPSVQELSRLIFKKVPAPRLDSAWRYDYSSRELRRTKAWKDPERVFRNGLRGFLPDLDLAEALVERALDDGAEQKALAAFAHAYTDREGGVVPGITLYDAWACGAEIEMPDVDALGIVHTVLGDWKTWRAPVPASKHEALYDRIGELFVPAQRHRGLRHAIASCYLAGSAVLRDGYTDQLDNFHALWEDCRSTPAEMAKRLPPAAKRSEFLAAWTATCHAKGAVWQAGLARHKTLDREAEAVRTLLLRLLGEFTPPSAGGKPGGKDR